MLKTRIAKFTLQFETRIPDGDQLEVFSDVTEETAKIMALGRRSGCKAVSALAAVRAKIDQSNQGMKQ
jgi:hypothetical protein